MIDSWAPLAIESVGCMVADTTAPTQNYYCTESGSKYCRSLRFLFPISVRFFAMCQQWQETTCFLQRWGTRDLSTGLFLPNNYCEAAAEVLKCNYSQAVAWAATKPFFTYPLLCNLNMTLTNCPEKLCYIELWSKTTPTDREKTGPLLKNLHQWFTHTDFTWTAAQVY